MPSERSTLAVLGAGPKGLAVAVKAKVLAELGFPVDRVVLIERHSVGANWSGQAGFTNGELKLGTSPEKDVVFPIETDVGDDVLNARLRKRLLEFTWTSFLVESQRLSDWIDRGRPAPCHELWSLYLKWVSEQLAPEVEIVRAEVVGIDRDAEGSAWKIDLRAPEGQELPSLSAERLMLTGPGRARADFHRPNGRNPEGVYDLESFWKALRAGSFATSGRVAIVGAGENAASTLLALAKAAPELQIDVIAPKGFVSTRAENFYENRFYSQPEKTGWTDLEPAHRLEFIQRTDLGVFSVHAMQILNEERDHRIVPGRVVSIDTRPAGLSLQLEYGRQVSERVYDRIILATGFDQVARIESLFSEDALEAISEAVEHPRLEASSLARQIDEDLSVRGLSPALHLPGLAGLTQGPGFANLSCLGRLSDRVVVEPTLERLRRRPGLRVVGAGK